jgi:hypothetical protein
LAFYDSSLNDDERRKAAAVDRIVDTVLDLGLDDYAQVLLDMYGRYEVLGQMSYMTLAPVMAAFFGKEGLDLSQVLGLTPREGSQMILDRLKVVKAERQKEKTYSKQESLWPIIKEWFLNKIPHLKNRVH